MNKVQKALRSRAKDRFAPIEFTLEDDDAGTLEFRAHSATVSELLKYSDAVPAVFSGIRGTVEDGNVDAEEALKNTFDSIDVSRALVCAMVELKVEDAYLPIVDKTPQECEDNEIPIDAFTDEQLAKMVGEAYPRIRFR